MKYYDLLCWNEVWWVVRFEAEDGQRDGPWRVLGIADVGGGEIWVVKGRMAILVDGDIPGGGDRDITED